MDTLRSPNSLSFEGNVSENWRRWIQQFRLYLNATGRDRKPDIVQCSTLLTVAGEDAVEIYNTFTFASGETDKIEPLISKFHAYCIPKKNITFERHVFNTRIQATKVWKVTLLIYGNLPKHASLANFVTRLFEIVSLLG